MHGTPTNYARGLQTIAHPNCFSIAFDKDGDRNTRDDEQLCAYRPMVLGSHDHKGTAHEHQCQTCQRVDGPIPMCCADSDCLDVERHRHKYQAGERDCACSDEEKEVSPLPRPKDIGCS